MSEITPNEVRAHIHNIDDATVAEIIATGISLEQLKNACRFFAKEKKTHAHATIPGGAAGRVVSILERVDAQFHDSIFGEGGSTMA